MGDLDDLAAAAQSRIHYRRKAVRKSLPPAAIWGIVGGAAFLVLVVIAGISSPKNPISKTPPDVSVDAVVASEVARRSQGPTDYLPGTYDDAVSRWKPENLVDASDEMDASGALVKRTLVFRMVNLKAEFVRDAKDQTDPEYYLSSTSDTTDRQELFPAEANSRFLDLDKRIAAANALVNYSNRAADLGYSSKPVHVRAYTRKDGTYVRAHDRTR